MMRKRIVQRQVDEQTAGFSGDCHPVLKRVWGGRNIRTEDDLDHRLGRLPHPELLAGMVPMVSRLSAALRRNERILIVADFDADGATGCVVAKRGLEMLGAMNVLFTVPDRFKFGYGLTPEIVEFAGRHNPNIILTVDNGISSIEGVRCARDQGIDVLITDHHLPGSELPKANVIVNPNLPNDPFPSKCLAGVGVVFYVLSALRKHLRESGWFDERGIAEPNLASLLDFVALGTVADVVELDHTNRILVHQGLLRIRKGLGHPGIRALLAVAGRSVGDLTASDLGFSIAPRLNAAGRLEDMAMGIECLLCDEFRQAMSIAGKLDTLNRERRDIESRMKEQALALLALDKLDDPLQLAAGICLYEESWHQGVVGIVASRIKDRLNRPVIAFASAGNGWIKGSARSIDGIHIRDLLSDLATRYPHLLSKFGGHAMAAGLSLKMEDFCEFSQLFSTMVAARSKGLDGEPVIYTDGGLDVSEMTLDFAELLQRVAPWGHGFPEPVFQGDFEVLESRVLKNQHVKFSLCLPEKDQVFDGIAFFVECPEAWLETDRIRLAYRLDVNEFRNVRRVQLMIEHMQALKSPA